MVFSIRHSSRQEQKIPILLTYLCVLFKKEMHHTILHYLMLIRIGWARLYLEQYPDKKVYEIGKMYGFDSPSYFGKKFTQIVGMTPEKYRYVNSITLNQQEPIPSLGIGSCA